MGEIYSEDEYGSGWVRYTVKMKVDVGEIQTMYFNGMRI